jgi:hypothetical protein
VTGEAYCFSNRAAHDKNELEQKLANLDGQIKYLRGSGVSSAEDIQKTGEIDKLNLEKKQLVNAFSGRKAVIDKWTAENEALENQASEVEGDPVHHYRELPLPRRRSLCYPRDVLTKFLR